MKYYTKIIAALMAIALAVSSPASLHTTSSTIHIPLHQPLPLVSR